MNADGHKSEIDKVTEKMIGCACPSESRLSRTFFPRVPRRKFFIRVHPWFLIVY
jgi:hypothetical protein